MRPVCDENGRYGCYRAGRSVAKCATSTEIGKSSSDTRACSEYHALRSNLELKDSRRACCPVQAGTEAAPSEDFRMVELQGARTKVGPSGNWREAAGRLADNDAPFQIRRDARGAGRRAAVEFSASRTARLPMTF